MEEVSCPLFFLIDVKTWKRKPMYQAFMGVVVEGV
jgi:hypothetical protein